MRQRGEVPDDAHSAVEGSVGSGSSRFGVLVTPHLPAMLRVSAALVGVADAEDAAQEAVLRAWQAWEALREPGALRAWLLRITTHVCQDWQRGRFGTRRARTLPLLDQGGEAPLALLGADPGASDHTGAMDLRQAINRLDTDLRVVLVLRYYAEMDATEVGAALGLPPATVRTRLRRALMVLRECLDSPSAARAAQTEKGGG